LFSGGDFHTMVGMGNSCGICVPGLERDEVVGEIVSRLEVAGRGGQVVQVEGTWGSFGALLAGYILGRLGRPILYIRGHVDEADKLCDDLHTFTGRPVELLEAWEGQGQAADATDEIWSSRLRVMLEAVRGVGGSVFVASAQALCQPVCNPAVLREHCLRLGVGERIGPEGVVSWLVENGFEGVDRIDLPGQFARRGGIVDMFAPLISERRIDGGQSAESSRRGCAIRVEFFADEIESVREIDVDTQRSRQELEEVGVVSAACGRGRGQRELFVNVLPAETIVILAEPAEIAEVADVYLQRASDSAQLYDWGQIYAALGRLSQLRLCRFAGAAGEEFLKLKVGSVQQFEHTASSTWLGHKAALEQLVAEAKAGRDVYLYCERQGEIQRVREIIEENFDWVPARFRLLAGFIHQGFVVHSLKRIVISHHELSGQFAVRRAPRAVRAAAPVDALSDLQVGDYVVHLSYGIGKFLGVQTIEKKGAGKGEYLTIAYADGVRKQVSVRNIGLVQKYIGSSQRRPKLSRAGSNRWQRQKERVSQSVEDLASELLEIQARREAMGGIAYGPDSTWQVEFEESFAYVQTADQVTVAEQIKRDMERPVAMERLLCGDVGYGKTELAMRAAFKAVENGRQVAVLVPTTVLSVQHGRTFRERFGDFPVNIEVLNRFRTASETCEILSRAKSGRVDILIGTHRLLSGDVGFRDLGLLIIDEEQRFGVEHKEKLKRLRVNVDVLTLTATPIPRTLHMSLLGLRDISSLATPPLDRRSVVTEVTRYNRDLIRKGILRELNRRGQVFFLHNRVQTIDRKAWEIRRLVPEARVGIAHGQMPKVQLEESMIEFVKGQLDVLVCTTIIESGLDIPNANTIFIDQADRFGLAQLHQLRGRVGRYKYRAYAYMLLPAGRSITPLAARRLKAIEQYSHLGAGFRIALRDLEIRGAGNILGSAQSGHIQAVGYQLYCDLLADAVRRLKGEPVEQRVTSVVDLGFSSYIPKSYIGSDRQRMEVYRKVAAARQRSEMEQIETELSDIYGPVPEEVRLLLEVAELRAAASRRDIRAIVVSGRDVVFSFRDGAAGRAGRLFDGAAGEMRIVDGRTAVLRLGENYFEARTLIAVVRKILGVKKDVDGGNGIAD